MAVPKKRHLRRRTTLVTASTHRAAQLFGGLRHLSQPQQLLLGQPIEAEGGLLPAVSTTFQDGGRSCTPTQGLVHRGAGSHRLPRSQRKRRRLWVSVLRPRKRVSKQTPGPQVPWFTPTYPVLITSLYCIIG